MKTCTKCQTLKNLEDFTKDKRRSDGRGSWCVPCNRAYMRALIKTPKVAASRKKHYETNRDQITAQNRDRWSLKKDQYREASDKWRVENRDSLLGDYRQRGAKHRAFLDSLKSKPCLDCGETYPPYCMEFDHVRGDKRFALGKMANHRREAVLDELTKCELVCCACHRVRTQARNTHGEHKGLYSAWSKARLHSFREWLNGLKAKPCMDCGRSRPAVAMDFDHTQGEKVHGISSMWSWGRERVLEELAKCELVCCICHRIRTQSRRSEQRAAA